MKRISLSSLKRSMLKDPKYRDFHFNQPAGFQAAQLIKRVRVERGLTQAKFGRNLGLPQATIARMENGTRYVSLRTLEKVLKKFGLVLILSARKRKT